MADFTRSKKLLERHIEKGEFSKNAKFVIENELSRLYIITGVI